MTNDERREEHRQHVEIVTLMIMWALFITLAVMSAEDGYQIVVLLSGAVMWLSIDNRIEEGIRSAEDKRKRDRHDE